MDTQPAQRTRDLEPTAQRVAVLVPCFNEAAAVGKVVADFQAALPGAQIFVYDNNSTDDTRAIARAAGAIVRSEPQQGKGHVVRRMFSDIEADIYVLVDGDDTYDAAAAPRLIERLRDDGLDMVNASRRAKSEGSYRPGHRFGNALFSSTVRFIFGPALQDLLSGYRVLSRRFVKSFPALAEGFEIETELTVHALELKLPLAEVVTDYRERPVGSVSKLRTWRDGFRILWTIARLLKAERPLELFSVLAFLSALAAIVLAIPIFRTFLEIGLVPRLPTAVLSVGLMLIAALSLACGLILDTVTRGRRELRRLFYLQQR